MGIFATYISPFLKFILKMRRLQMIKKIGAQIFTVRDFLGDEEQIRSSFKKLKAIGYDTIQTAGVPKISYELFGKIAAECGIEICGTHDDFQCMLDTPEIAIENHKLLNTKIMGIGGKGFLDGPDEAVGYHTEEQLWNTIKQINTVTDSIGHAGFIFTYHNHGHEFAKRDGKNIMDIIFENTDKNRFKMCLDTYWAQYTGIDVCKFIKEHGDRIAILHLKDMGRGRKGPCMAEIGQRNMNWQGIIEESVNAGIEHFIVEQDDCYGKDPFECLKTSYDYISKNFM